METSSSRRDLMITMLAGATLGTKAKAQEPKLVVKQIKNDLYEIEGDGGNVAVYITDEGVILVDDKFERDYESIMTHVKSLTSKPVKYVLSTHYHSDHSGGNSKFLPAAEIISTANARNAIVEHKQPNATGVAPARVVFTQEAGVFLGGKEVHSRYCGRGHTNGDAIVYFPSLRTIHTGDLMAGPSPLIDYSAGGSLVEWTKTLDEALKLDFDTVIPGHGPVTTKAGLLAYRNNNVERLRIRATELIREGRSQDDVGKVMIAEFGWAPDNLLMQWNLPGMMKELKADH